MSNRNSWGGFRPATLRGLQVGILATLCSVAGSRIASAASISLVPSQTNLSVGDSVTVDLDISGLAADAAPSLGGFDITIDVPSIFTFSNVAFGDPILGDQLSLLGSGSLTDTIPGANSYELIEVSFDSVSTLNSLQPSAFTLAVLTFLANSSGSGNLSLANITLSDASGASLTSSVSNAAFDVSSVPEPSAILPLAGLMALIVTMRKRISATVRR